MSHDGIIKPCFMNMHQSHVFCLVVVEISQRLRQANMRTDLWNNGFANYVLGMGNPRCVMFATMLVLIKQEREITAYTKEASMHFAR